MTGPLNGNNLHVPASQRGLTWDSTSGLAHCKLGRRQKPVTVQSQHEAEDRTEVLHCKTCQKASERQVPLTTSNTEQKFQTLRTKLQPKYIALGESHSTMTKKSMTTAEAATSRRPYKIWQKHNLVVVPERSTEDTEPVHQFSTNNSTGGAYQDEQKQQKHFCKVENWRWLATLILA